MRGTGTIISEVTLVTILVGLSGCPMTGAADQTAKQPTAQDLFKTITQTDPYQNWGQFPDAQGIVPSSAPHGPMARIFINEPVEQALDADVGQLPDGAIIVKEQVGQSDSDKAEALTIMWKVDGFDPQNNDWFWADIKPDGTVMAEGKIDGCISCHSIVRDNDFVYTQTL